MSDHTVRLKSTPVKPTKPPPVNRKEMSALHLPPDSLIPNTEFCRTWLNVHDAIKHLVVDEELKTLAEAVQKSKETCYKKVEILLNYASGLIHNELCPSLEFIVFVDNHSFVPTNHPNEIKGGAPDSVGILESVLKKLQEDERNRIPCHLTLTAVEEKTAVDAKVGPAQCGAYLGYANQARPDMVGMYGLSVSPRSFQIQYSCAAGLATSEEFNWTAQLGGILAYVCTLYLPRTDFAPRDTTISLATGRDILGPPLWDIDVGDKVYRNCKVQFVGQPWTRMTWVVKAETDNEEGPIMIKDSYRDVRTRFKEGDMYEILHKEGSAPGFAAVDREYEVKYTDTPITVSMKECTRIKTRLIMKTSGLALNHCKNIVDFFKGMYDILEAHRWMVTERKLLHRDISHGNIVVEAKDSPQIPKFTGKPPIFINEVLRGEPAPPMARLLDMDNCARLDTMAGETKTVVDATDQPLRYRTGTPKFIARSVAIGEILVECGVLPMPTLQSDIAEKYKRAYHEDISKLRSFSDANGSSHGGYPDAARIALIQTDPDFGADMFEHQPFHDAESVYWCIAAFVLLAKPLNSDVDENNDAFNEMWTCLAEHEVGNDNDKRLPLIHRCKWKHWLHRDLSFIADLMVALSFQVRPEWTLVTPGPDPLHLHEAMQRLILQYVHDWEKNRINVELDTVYSRAFTPVERKPMAQVCKHPLKGQVITSSTLGKRGSKTGRAQSGSKRLRKTGDDEPLGADLAELQQAWVDSQSVPVAAELL
ncbi:hypothetical protein PC9H_004416 [Pleurotus ostreatus]|uniref:Fungal-type protein kinase domain-containing protein n=1 Tax=Pleurotus ostreatus TaxID=5322 RepID=A0A8H7A2N2_PLEOS|nr:uncharacterized protein PC9H_004416 [Pleurotus ostreatus]KAF7437574.1 hypothetical protein PC9H_004416 [Pleurotus ostreatus]